MVPGKFITLEGTEGVGKSTNLAFVSDWLRQRGVPLLVTREPGGTPLAEEIRQLLLARRDESVDAKAELLLVFAARAQHLARTIVPALQQGTWVLSDRFTDATYAYQGLGRSLPLDVITLLESLVQEGLQPDLTLLLDIDVEIGLARAGQRGELDRFETEEVEFFRRVRCGYQQRVQSAPERYRVIDASGTLEAVQEQLVKVMESFLKQSGMTGNA